MGKTVRGLIWQARLERQVEKEHCRTLLKGLCWQKGPTHIWTSGQDEGLSAGCLEVVLSSNRGYGNTAAGMIAGFGSIPQVSLYERVVVDYLVPAIAGLSSRSLCVLPRPLAEIPK